MKISELQDWIEANSEIGLDLDKASREVPKLHSRAINIKANETAILKSLELEMDARKRDRWIYYSGKADAKVYKDEPFDLKVLKSDLDIFMDADKRITEIRSKIETQKIKVAMLDEYIKSISQRTFLIKSIIDYQRLMNGLA